MAMNEITVRFDTAKAVEDLRVIRGVGGRVTSGGQPIKGALRKATAIVNPPAYGFAAMDYGFSRDEEQMVIVERGEAERCGFNVPDSDDVCVKDRGHDGFHERGTIPDMTPESLREERRQEWNTTDDPERLVGLLPEWLGGGEDAPRDDRITGTILREAGRMCGQDFIARHVRWLNDRMLHKNTRVALSRDFVGSTRNDVLYRERDRLERMGFVGWHLDRQVDAIRETFDRMACDAIRKHHRNPYEPQAAGLRGAWPKGEE